MTALADVFVKVKPDTTGLTTEMKREVEAAAKRVDAKINVQAKINLDRSILSGELAKLRTEFARTGDLSIKAKISDVEKLFAPIVKGATSTGISAGSAIGSAMQGQIGTAMKNPYIAAALVGTVVAALPVIGAAVGAAVITGIATAGIGAGLAIAFQDPVVKLAGAELGKTIKAELFDVAQPFIAEVRKAIPNIAALFVSIKPQLASIFSDLAPQFDTVIAGLLSGIKAAMPGIQEAIAAAKPFADSLGQTLAALGNAIGGFFATIAANKQGALAFFHLLSDTLIGTVVILGDVIAALGLVFSGSIKIAKGIDDVFIVLIKSIEPVVDTLVKLGITSKGVGEALHGAASGAEGFDKYLSDMLNGSDTAIPKLGNLGTAVALTGRDAVNASLAFAQATQAFKAQQQANADAVTSTARAVTQANQGVADANHGVMLANRALQDSQYAVGQAERTLVKDHQAEKQAQLDLTKARKDAAQQLVDLKKQVRDSADATTDAKIRLEEANIAEQLTRGLSSDNLERQKALQSQKEAQEAYSDSLVNGKKATTDYNNAQKKGIEGNQGVIDARQKVKDTHQQTIDDEGALTKAKQAEADADYALQKSHQAVSDAILAQKDAVKEHKKAVDNNSTSLDINTTAGANNEAALLKIWDAYVLLHPTLATSYNDFVAQAEAMGLTVTQAEDIAKKLGLIPANTLVTVTTLGKVDLSQITGITDSATANAAAALLNKGTDLNKLYGIGKAAGGRIEGPGSETSDDVPIWASKDEWVIKAAAANHYGHDFMKNLNAMKIPKLAAGGAINDHSAAIEEILGVAKASGIPFDSPTHGQLTGGKHVSGSLHYQGKAVDFGGGTRAGMSGNVNKLSQYFMDHYGKNLLEEIHTKSGPPYQGWYIKDGKVVSPYGPAGNHLNHLHLGADAGFTKGAVKGIVSSPSSTPGVPTTTINPEDLKNGINILKLMGIAITQNQAIGGVFKTFGIPFKTTTSFSKLVSPTVPTNLGNAGGKLVGASMYGGPSDPSSGTHGYHGDSLIGKNAFAELSTVPRGKNSDFAALGKLPYKQKAHISYNGKTVDAEKLDIGGGGGPIAGHHRDVDLWYQTAQKLGFKGTGLVNFKTYDQGGWLKDSPGINTSGKPEAVLNPDESAGLKAAVKGNGEIRLDSYSIQRLAQLIAMMKFTINIDGKPVAVAMTPHLNQQFASSGY